MSNHVAPQPSFFEKMRSQAVRWSVWAGLVIGIVLLILAHLHVVHGEVAIGLVLALILIFSEQQHEQAHAMQHAMQQLTQAVVKQSEQIENLVDTAFPSLLSLQDSVNDMARFLDQVKPDEEVVIEHFGLDMAQVWTYVERVLREKTNLCRITYRLLVITNHPAELTTDNREVKTWSETVKSQTLKRIQKDVDNMRMDLLQAKRQLQFIVKKYTSEPTLHGIRLKSPERCHVCYLAMCRWGGGTFDRYDFGDPQYHRIVGLPLDATHKDLLTIYETYFQHHWRQPNRLLLELEVKPPVVGPEATT